VRTRSLSIGLPFLLALLSGACGPRAELREWQPSDHQPPPTVAPEGQGSGEEGGDAEQQAAVALWNLRCGSCHGETGRGDGPAKPPGAVLPDFSSPAFHASRSDEQLVEVIRKGRGLMPPFGAELTEAGTAVLVKHVRSLRVTPP
jgi:mono/diheme cytochrome c family protein